MGTGETCALIGIGGSLSTKERAVEEPKTGSVVEVQVLLREVVFGCEILIVRLLYGSTSRPSDHHSECICAASSRFAFTFT